MSAAALYAGLAAPAWGQDLTLGSVEGEWTGSVAGGHRGLEILFAVTDDAARLFLDGLMVNCQMVVRPTSETGAFEAFPYGRRSRNCPEGTAFDVAQRGDELYVWHESWDEWAELERLTGPSSGDWVEAAPAQASMLGVEIGAEATDLAGVLPEGAVIASPRPLEQVFPRQARSGSMLDAQLRVVSFPRDVGVVDQRISFDNAGVFSIDGRVFAILRRWDPPEDAAPRYDAIQEALIEKLGAPRVERRSGRGMSYEWHFAPDGSVIPSGEDTACHTRFNGSMEDQRSVGFRYNKIEINRVELSLGHSPRIETAMEEEALRTASGCGFSIRYHIHPRENGLLSYLDAVVFAHEPLAAEIWEDRSTAFADELREAIELHESSQGVEPKL